MKKILTILSIAFTIAVIAPSCSSDDNFEDVVSNSQLDQTAPTDPESGGGKQQPGG
jgi:hypothetical protein